MIRFGLPSLSKHDGSRSENFAPRDEPVVEAAGREVIGPVAGLALVCLAISGLLDDSGLLPHSLWFVIGLLAVSIGVFVAGSVVRKLLLHESR